jgi:hypothetical protein
MTRLSLWLRAAALTGIVTTSAFAQAKPAPKPPPPPIKFASRGLPPRRVGGGVRGIPAVLLLAPANQVSPTIQAAPVVYLLYSSPDADTKPQRASLRLDAGSSGSKTASVELRADRVTTIDFAALGFTLGEGAEDTLAVHVTLPSGELSTTYLLLARERDRAFPDLETPSVGLARRLAAKGLFIDAIATLQRLVIADQGADQTLVALRDDFVHDVLKISVTDW